MITCKIGIIAIWKGSKDKTLYIGEIFRKIDKNTFNLYSIHCNLKYLYPFRVRVVKGECYLDNSEDINFFKKQYKLNYNVYTKENLPDGIYKYNPPKLYDISCMIPLFSDTISRNIITNKQCVKCRMFILLPYLDPIIRGKIVDSCLSLITECVRGLFFVLGDRQGDNIKTISDLYRRYLVQRGIKAECITKNVYSQIPYCIMEALIILDTMFTREEDIEIYLGVSSDTISEILTYVREINRIGLLSRKIKFICDY